MGMPNPAKMKSEISELEGKRSELMGAKEQMKGALSELNGKKGEIQRNLSKLHDQLQQEIPPHIKEQILQQISMLKNALSQIRSQMSTVRERLGFISEALENISQGISARKNAMQMIAGQIAQQMMARREEGGGVRKA